MGRGQPVDHVYAIPLINNPALSSSRPRPGTVAIGGLTEAKYSALTGDLLVVGWLLAPDDVEVWLENERGEEFGLEGAYRFFLSEEKQTDAVQYPRHSINAGLMHRLPDVPFSTHLKLMMSDGDTVRMLAACPVSLLPSDPAQAARYLAGFTLPGPSLCQRIACVDLPLLGPLMDEDRLSWPQLSVERHALGTCPSAPKVSLIIPLFGRSDFVEHHLIEFQRDPWFEAHVEVIYVIDDVRLLESFSTQAVQWHRLYQQSFQWIWGSANRGYSGANNLGAQFALGTTLLFMNSDVVPTQPGWVQAMIEALDHNPVMGAVTPRLLFADGSLQHVGVQFMKREDLGVWINHHPYAGSPPEADPCKTLTSIAAVTGACMAIPRHYFDQVGGWDTGYLIGDFEDSDLCLKLRAIGLETGYLPDVSLVHLERQSLSLSVEKEFRQYVTLLNAIRHQQRWAKVLEPFVTTGLNQSGKRGI